MNREYQGFRETVRRESCYRSYTWFVPNGVKTYSFNSESLQVIKQVQVYQPFLVLTPKKRELNPRQKDTTR